MKTISAIVGIANIAMGLFWVLHGETEKATLNLVVANTMLLCFMYGEKKK